MVGGPSYKMVRNRGMLRTLLPWEANDPAEGNATLI